MGLSALSTRQLMLVDKFNDIELQASTISNERIELSRQKEQIESIFNTETGQGNQKGKLDLDAELPKGGGEAQANYQAQISQIEKLDTKLEQKLEKLETQRKAIAKELKSVKDLVDGKIFDSFLEMDGTSATTKPNTNSNTKTKGAAKNKPNAAANTPAKAKGAATTKAKGNGKAKGK